MKVIKLQIWYAVHVKHHFKEDRKKLMNLQLKIGVFNYFKLHEVLRIGLNHCFKLDETLRTGLNHCFKLDEVLRISLNNYFKLDKCREHA